MRVTIISETCQEFGGVKFYRCGYYFSSQRKSQIGSKRLHRIVWQHFNGPIPKGFHIHHKDTNRSNNQIENLELLDAKTHLSNHMTPERREAARLDMVQRVIPMAKLWHGTEEGKRWHSKHAKNVAASMPLITKTCIFCKTEYQTKKHMEWKSQYCHPNCKMAARRKRLNPSLIPKPRKKCIV